jgi:hypothetical protein
MPTKFGRDLHPQPPPTPLPQLDAATPSRVLAMVHLLLKHQAELANDRARTIVIQTNGDGRLSLKCTFDFDV